tara:strand:+ start:1489 stop:2271 length:783 start_codon:yes stop_codon:yes gene_type:complete
MVETYLGNVELDNSEIAQFAIARRFIAELRDNDPEALEEALDVEGVDVRTESTNNLLGYYVQNLAAAVAEGDDAQNENDAMMSVIPQSTKNSLAQSVLSYAQAMDFSGPVAQGRFLNAEGENRSGCDFDDCDGVNYMSDCFDWCLVNEGGWTGASCNDQNATNYGANALCEYQSGFGQFFSTFTSTVGNIAEDIGWDNIFGSLFGTNDSGQQTDEDGNVTIVVQGGDDEKDFNWGKLAFGVLGTVLVVGGIIYFVRKNKE